MRIAGAGREIAKDYNEIYLHEDDEARIAKVEMWMAKSIGTEILNHYPNRQWSVNVDAMGGIIVIMCPSLSHNKGYHLYN